MRSPSNIELKILEYLFGEADIKFNAADLEVEPMNDGAMGSLKIGADHENRKFGSMAAEKEYKDSDGVAFLASLYLDQDKAPYELDIFKVDFSSTKVLNENSLQGN